MAMLMTATRSPSRPARAPRVMGVLRSTAARSMLTRLNDLPAAAQPRKAKMNSTKAMASTRFCQRPKPRTSCTPPMKARTTATPMPSGPAGIDRSGIPLKVSMGRAMPKAALPSPQAPTPKNHSTKAASSR